MTVILHIGSHKTGTTAIQRFASAHRKDLRRAGLWYPNFREAGVKVSHYAHHHAANAVAHDSNIMSLADAERFFRHVTRKKRADETVLISAEPIYRQLIVPGGKARSQLRGKEFWTAHRAYLERLRSLIDTDDLKVLVIFRRQDSFAPSMYQEHVKATNYVGKFPRFIREKHHLFDYLRHTRELSKVFPTVMARPFDRLLGGAGLVDEFFGLLGIRLSSNGKAGQNLSLPHELVEFKRLMNRTSLPRDKRKSLENLLMDLAMSEDFIKSPKYHWISHDEMVAFQRTFDEDNRHIHQYSDFDGGAGFFSDAALEPADVFPGLSTERMLEIASRLIFP